MNEFESEMGDFFANSLEVFPTETIVSKNGSFQGLVDIVKESKEKIHGGIKSNIQMQIHLLESDRELRDVKEGTVLTIPNMDLTIRVTKLADLRSGERTLICGPVNQSKALPEYRR